MTRMRSSWLHLASSPRLSDAFTGSSPSPESRGSKSPDVTESTISYLADLLKDTREELGRADSKAALLLAATGVAAGALLGGLLNGRWTPFSLDNSVEWLWWLGVGSAVAGVFSTAAVVYPRRINPRKPHTKKTAENPPTPQKPLTPAYFGDVVAYENVEKFNEAIDQVPSPKERLLEQTFVLSKVVMRKYKLLRLGLLFLLFAILACAAAVLINIPLSH